MLYGRLATTLTLPPGLPPPGRAAADEDEIAWLPPLLPAAGCEEAAAAGASDVDDEEEDAGLDAAEGVASSGRGCSIMERTIASRLTITASPLTSVSSGTCIPRGGWGWVGWFGGRAGPGLAWPGWWEQAQMGWLWLAACVRACMRDGEGAWRCGAMVGWCGGARG